MINKFLLFGVGGAGVAGTGTGLGVYYGIQGRETKGIGQQEAVSQEREQSLDFQDQSQARDDESSSSVGTDGPSGPVPPAPPA